MSKANLRIRENNCVVLSVPVGGPTALGYTISYNLFSCFPLCSQYGQLPVVVVGPPTGTDTFIRLSSTTAGSLRSPAVRQVCPPTGAMQAQVPIVISHFCLPLGNGNYPVNFSYFLEHEPKVAQVTPILFPCHFLAYQYSVPSSTNLPNPYFKANG